LQVVAPALTFQTSSKKLERLNSIIGVFEYEVEENGDLHWKIVSLRSP